jgi:hypothetical protein
MIPQIDVDTNVCTAVISPSITGIHNVITIWIQEWFLCVTNCLWDCRENSTTTLQRWTTFFILGHTSTTNTRRLSEIIIRPSPLSWMAVTSCHDYNRLTSSVHDSVCAD